MLPTPTKHEVDNVDQNPAETKPNLQADVTAIETWLKNVWDRAKKTAEMIARLRQEKAELQERIISMEEEVLRLRQELAKQEQAVKAAVPLEPGNHVVLSNGEREQLSAKVKELLTRLDGYV